MKKDIHPQYRDVIFMDTSTGTRYLMKSTIRSKESATWDDGNEYPLVKVEISAASHQFYTGKMKFVDSAGRVEKFQKKYNWGKKGSCRVATVIQKSEEDVRDDSCTSFVFVGSEFPVTLG